MGSLKVTNLLPPDKKAGLPPPQYNADAPELTPSAIKDTTKSNRSSSNAQRLMKKSGLVGGAVGVLKSKAKNIGGSVIKSLF